VHQHILVALEVAEKFADVPLKTVDAGYLAHVLALRPTVQASKFTPAPYPAAVPQAPFRPLQMTNGLICKISIGHARPRAVCNPCSKRMATCHQSSAHRGRRERLALQPPQPSISIAQHRRRRVGVHPAAASACANASAEAPLGRCGEGEAVLGASGIKSPCPQSPRNGVPPAGADYERSHHQADHHRASYGFAVASPSRWRNWPTTFSPTRSVLFRTVPAFCAPLIGSNSDSRIATVPNGASAA